MRLLVLVVAGALAACGSSEPLSKQELVTKADAVCETHNEQFRGLLTEIDESWSDERWKDFYKRWTEEHRKQVDDLGDLDTTDQAFRQYLDRLERNADGYEQAVEDGDVLSEAFASKANNSEHDVSFLADDAGLHHCSPLDYF
jgi:hypothetical protein